MISLLRNILIPTVLVVTVLFPGVLSADVIRLRHSVRRAAIDQPIRLGDISILEGPQAVALSKTIILPAEACEDTGVIRIRVTEVRDVLQAANVYWGTLDLEGGVTLVRPPASAGRMRDRKPDVQASAVTASERVTPSLVTGTLEATPFVAASDLLETGGNVARQIAKSMIVAWGPEAARLRLAIDATAAEALIVDAAAFSVELLGDPRGDRCNAKITQQRQDGRPARATLARVDIRIVRTVPIASRNLAAGRELDPSDFDLADRAIRPSEVVLEIDALEDRRLAKPLAEGSALTAGLLKAEFVVERQGEVLILATGAGVRVEVPGIAMQKGRIGDTIECRLRTAGERDRNARFSAVVIGPGRVRLPDR